MRRTARTPRAPSSNRPPLRACRFRRGRSHQRGIRSEPITPCPNGFATRSSASSCTGEFIPCPRTAASGMNCICMVTPARSNGTRNISARRTNSATRILSRCSPPPNGIRMRGRNFSKRPGAKFIIPTAEHHDGFALWNSTINKYNAVQMGPHRDLIGDLSKAVRKQGLKFGVSNHGIEHFYFHQTEGRRDQRPLRSAVEGFLQRGRP